MLCTLQTLHTECILIHIINERDSLNNIYNPISTKICESNTLKKKKYIYLIRIIINANIMLIRHIYIQQSKPILSIIISSITNTSLVYMSYHYYSYYPCIYALELVTALSSFVNPMIKADTNLI